ncbi:MAG: hypothetical protein WD851_18310 [Pirellulales bacterium]
MPCYLFSYHTYRSWMPDRPQGYVQRGNGILPCDPRMADLYCEAATYDEALLNEEHQIIIVERLRGAVNHIGCRLHFVATEPTHIHMLVSWRDERPWQLKRTSLKRSITIELKARFDDRPWLSNGSSRKRVKDQQHFDYLVTKYLPDHSGWKWCEVRGLFK